MDSVKIRDAEPDDAERLLEIYAYYVENTAITFEYTVPDAAAFQERMERTMERYPYLVAEVSGVVRGFAYAGPFVGRAAYDWSCETTIYLEPAARKRGYGRLLYAALEHEVHRMGILNLYACIGYPTTEDAYLDKNSAEFHAHMGFTKVGEFHNCGYKFDRWYDMIWMEKIIGLHGEEQPPVQSYPSLTDAEEEGHSDGLRGFPSRRRWIPNWPYEPKF